MRDIVIESINKEEIRSIIDIKKSIHNEFIENLPHVYKESDVLYTENFLSKFFKANTENRIFVAKSNNNVAGYAFVEIIRVNVPMMQKIKYIYIHDIAVDKQYRKNGVASKLIEYVEGYGKTIGVDRVELAVHLFSKSAISLYEKKGYTPRTLRMEKKID